MAAAGGTVTQKGEHARRGSNLRRAKPRLAKPPISTPTEKTIESARVPSIVGGVDYLRRLTTVFANDVVCRDIRSAYLEPPDRALTIA